MIRVSMLVVAFSFTFLVTSSFASEETSYAFVSNKDKSMSVLKCEKPGDNDANFLPCKEKENVPVGFSTSWPANQYDGNKDWWWTGLSGQVVGLKAREQASKLLKDKNKIYVNTYTYAGVPEGLPTAGANFIGTTPESKRVWNSAREIDEIQEIDADPKSATFGQIITHITALSADAGSGSATRGKMRPCDVSITPDGKYLWEPDIGGETITGVDIATKEVIAQLTLPRENPDNRVIPFMLTTNGKYALVENIEAPYGTYSIIDVSDPYHPKHVKKLTQADGLGRSPQTNEFTPDGQYAYLVSKGSPSFAGRVDVLNLETLVIEKNIAMPVGCTPHTGDFTNDGNYFLVNCSGNNSVAVISVQYQEVIQDVALSGTTPRGLIVR